jgi:hypothetical protein
MTALTRSQTRGRDWQILLFRIVAGLIAVGLFLFDGIGVIAPWFDLTSYRALEYQVPLQRWYDARWGAYSGTLFTGCLLALLWRPHPQPLLLQFLVLTGIILAAIGAAFDPFGSIVRITVVALLVVAYPRRATLTQFARSHRLSWPLLALSLPVATLLAFDVWRSIQPNLAATSTYTHDRHSLEAVMLSIALVLAALLAATRRPGWQALGLLTGAALIYLGLAAAKLPDRAGSWGAAGAALATLIGWAFVGATAWEARRMRKDTADWNNATSLISK